MEPRKRQQAAWAFMMAAVREYVAQLSTITNKSVRISSPAIALNYKLDENAQAIAERVGNEAASLPFLDASFRLSACYTVLVPAELRKSLGMYFTPPEITGRLINMATEAGTNWETARVLDPACGGGAFLLPAALKMREATNSLAPAQQLDNIVSRLRGFEIDPFAAWLTQAWLEIALGDLASKLNRRLPPVVQICDALLQVPRDEPFDLVIGNPPYGRVSLSPEQRHRFAKSLFGHANLYGLFTNLALDWVKDKGVVAYVTPTSFLSGEYFKNLRSLLACEAPPVALDIIKERKGVFEDVLQETLLATYRRGDKRKMGTVRFVGNGLQSSSDISAGVFELPDSGKDPWLVPREPEHQRIVRELSRSSSKLRDWGYTVSTGPLVWNRHKSQICENPGPNTFPLVWAEAITSRKFSHKATSRGHKPYFRCKDRSDDWLKISEACVLVQRTTAKEQMRRLVAAELPKAFVREHGSVVVENHVNVLKPIEGASRIVAPAVLVAVLNSKTLDSVFRCMSGSVAVSAFELKAVPFPPLERLEKLERLVERGADTDDVEAIIHDLYFKGEAI